MSINTIPFSKINNADFYVDTIYQGGNSNNHYSSEVLSRLMHVGNTGGFRKCRKTVNGRKINDVAYACVYTTGEELEWRDELDRTLGRFTYWGDNRVAGNPLLKTKLGGNKFLHDLYNNLAIGMRYKCAPIFVFQKYCSRDVIFLGVAVPGDGRINPHDS